MLLKVGLLPRMMIFFASAGHFVPERRKDAMNRLLLSLLMLPLSAACAAADNPRARDLVRRLGDESYRVREEASKELLRLGLEARDALLQGTRDNDLEIRRRCRDLLPSILEADRQARLEELLADTEDKRDHGVPGWSRFRKVAGADVAARKFFVAVCRQDTGLLADTEKDPTRAGGCCATVCTQLFQKLYGPQARSGGQVEPAELAPLLLVAGDPRTNMPSQPRTMVVNFFYQPAIRAALLGDTNPAFKKLALAWMERQTDDEDAAQQMFFAVQNLELKEGLDLALKVLADRPLKGRGLGGAMTTVGKLGNRQHLAILERFLDDKTVLSNFALGTERGTTELRDVALAMLVHLTGQDHKTYGFVFSHNNSHLKFYANFVGFRDDDQRAKAFAQYKQGKTVSK
jgi:hypothetical protein